VIKMMQYQCYYCKYKFKSSKTPTKCPYCEKTGTITRLKSANELVDEVSREDKEDIMEV